MTVDVTFYKHVWDQLFTVDTILNPQPPDVIHDPLDHKTTVPCAKSVVCLFSKAVMTQAIIKLGNNCHHQILQS